jgi:spore maturation protein CgeB
LHNPDILNAEDIKKLKILLSKKTIWINWNGDFWPQNLETPAGRKLNFEFDIVGLVNKEVVKNYREVGINAYYWQIGYETDGVGYEPSDPIHKSDIVFLASGYSNERVNLVNQIRNDLGRQYNFALWGPRWTDSWVRGQSLYDFRLGCRLYRGAKISIGDSQWPESGFVSNRIFQALAAGGAMLAHQWFYGMDKLGMIDGETCIIWRTFDELKEKIHYYMSHEEDRKKIAENGHNMTLKDHSFSSRIIELFGLINELSKEEIELESWR